MKVFTAYITRKDGTKVYARDYGKKCFCFEVDGRMKKSRDRAAARAAAVRKNNNTM